MESKYRFAFIVSIATITILLVLNNQLMLGPLLVPISNDLNTSIALTGQLVAITSSTWAISGPSGGPFSDTYGRKPVVLVGITTMIIANLLTATSKQFISIAIGRLLLGMGAGLVPPTIVATIGDHVGIKSRGQAIGLMMAFSRLGTIIGLPLIAMLAESVSWRVPFIVISILLSILAVSFIFIFPTTENENPRPLDFFKRIYEAAKTPTFRPLLIANLMTQACTHLITTYFASLLVSRYSYSVSQSGLANGVVVGGMAFGNMTGGRLIGTSWGPKAALGALLITSVMGPAAFSIESNSLFTILFSSIMGFAVMLSVTSFLTITTNLNQEARGASVGLFAASNQTGAVLGAVSGGISLEATSSFSGLGLIITVLAITGVFFGTFALFRHTNKSQSGVRCIKEENNTVE